MSIIRRIKRKNNKFKMIKINLLLKKKVQTKYKTLIIRMILIIINHCNLKKTMMMIIRKNNLMNSENENILMY